MKKIYKTMVKILRKSYSNRKAKISKFSFIACQKSISPHSYMIRKGMVTHFSQFISVIPDPILFLRRVRTTRSSTTHSHPFQVTLPNARTLAHKSSFIPRTSQLWNSLPPTTFPESYNLSSFKSNVNKLDLVSLST